MNISKTNNTGAVQYVLCHNGVNIYHPIELRNGDTLETGQPYIEEFSTHTAFTLRLAELDIVLEE